MAAQASAGLLMCRWLGSDLEFFLLHPGGPFFKNKDAGSWSIPKGLSNAGEDLLDTARREFEEETGIVPMPPFHPIGSIQQKSGKIVHAWTFIGHWDPEKGITCNTFSLEWPPKSGKYQEFPEADKAAWMNYPKAVQFIMPLQIPLLDRAKEVLSRIAHSPR